MLSHASQFHSKESLHSGQCMTGHVPLVHHLPTDVGLVSTFSRHCSSPTSAGTRVAHTQVHTCARPAWMYVDACVDVHTQAGPRARPEVELGTEGTQS